MWKILNTIYIYSLLVSILCDDGTGVPNFNYLRRGSLFAMPSSATNSLNNPQPDNTPSTNTDINTQSDTVGDGSVDGKRDGKTQGVVLTQEQKEIAVEEMGGSNESFTSVTIESEVADLSARTTRSTSKLTIGEIITSFEGLGLLGFLLKKEPELLKILNDKNITTTFFAPTDESFKSLPLEALHKIANDRQYRLSVLGGLLVPEKVLSIHLSLESASYFKTATYRYMKLETSPFGQIVVDNHTIVMLPDVIAINGVIQVLGGCPLMPLIPTTDAMIVRPSSTRVDLPLGTLIQTLPPLSVLGQLIEGENRDVVNFLDRPDAQFTIFAPVDAAWGYLGPHTVEVLSGKYTLSELIRYHIFPGILDTSVIPDSKYVSAATLHLSDKSRIALVKRPDGLVFINDYSTVLVKSLRGSNGLVHLIDALLVPPETEAVAKKRFDQQERRKQAQADQNN
eukprot:GHVR01173866.1.p1 GENE.GHVR01173866.1~~GHVR01173866.1.p1  ORF type:complete len:453 (+),score=110.91 GHVR01173866.1:153-1511(+)